MERAEKKLYRMLNGTGHSSLVIGVALLVFGLVSGILLIVNGARLLKGKNKILL